MAMTARPGTAAPNRVARPVVGSMVASCWLPKSGPHMLYSVPEDDTANEAQFPPFVGPMSVVVILLPLTLIANTSAPPPDVV